MRDVSGDRVTGVIRLSIRSPLAESRRTGAKPAATRPRQCPPLEASLRSWRFLSLARSGSTTPLFQLILHPSSPLPLPIHPTSISCHLLLSLQRKLDTPRYARTENGAARLLRALTSFLPQSHGHNGWHRRPTNGSGQTRITSENSRYSQLRKDSRGSQARDAGEYAARIRKQICAHAGTILLDRLFFLGWGAVRTITPPRAKTILLKARCFVFLFAVHFLSLIKLALCGQEISP